MADEKQKTVAKEAAAGNTDPKAETPKEPKKMEITKETRARYTKADARTPSKGKVLDNDDPIAKAFRAISELGVDGVKAVAEANGEEILAKFNKYVASNLNPGQIRMNIGNAVRGKYNKGEAVYINGQKLQDTQLKAEHDKKEAEKKAKNAERLAKLNEKKSNPDPAKATPAPTKGSKAGK